MRLNIHGSSPDIPLKSMGLGQKASSAPVHGGKEDSPAANAEEPAGDASLYESFPPFVSSSTNYTACFFTAFQAVKSAVLVALNQIYKAALKKEAAEQDTVPSSPVTVPSSPVQQKLADILSKAQYEKRGPLNGYLLLNKLSTTPSRIRATIIWGSQQIKAALKYRCHKNNTAFAIKKKSEWASSASPKTDRAVKIPNSECRYRRLR